MKALAFCFIAYLICHVACGRKLLKPLDKTANVDFINMEAGGGVRPAPGPVKVSNQKPPPPLNTATSSVVSPPNYQTAEQLKPAAQPTPVTARVITPAPASKPAPVTPASKPAVAASKPLPQAAAHPTPGPGSVQHLINYYDSRGQASQIRPYSYSQAVKQGKPNKN